MDLQQPQQPQRHDSSISATASIAWSGSAGQEAKGHAAGLLMQDKKAPAAARGNPLLCMETQGGQLLAAEPADACLPRIASKRPRRRA